MIQKTLALASAAVIFASSLMLAQQKKRADEPKSEQQSRSLSDRLPLEIKGDRIGETLEDFKKHYPQSKCDEPSGNITKCQQNSHVSLAGLVTMDEICGFTDNDSMANCLFQGVHAWFEGGKLTGVLYSLPILGYESICESFTQKYGKPDELRKVEGGSACSWFRGGLWLIVSHARSPDRARANWYVMIQLSDSHPSKDI